MVGGATGNVDRCTWALGLLANPTQSLNGLNIFASSEVHNLLPINAVFPVLRDELPKETNNKIPLSLIFCARESFFRRVLKSWEYELRAVVKPISKGDRQILNKSLFFRVHFTEREKEWRSGCKKMGTIKVLGPTRSALKSLFILHSVTPSPNDEVTEGILVGPLLLLDEDGPKSFGVHCKYCYNTTFILTN